MIADLLKGYEPRDAVEQRDVARIRALVDEGGDPWSRAIPLHLTASALIVHPPSSRVLLRWHQRQQGWMQVGGHGDPGETEPLEVALREGREETGLVDLVPWPDARLAHVVIVPVNAGKGEPAHEHADLRFVLATADPDAVTPENADAPLRWLDLAAARAAVTVDNLRDLLDRTAERLLTA